MLINGINVTVFSVPFVTIPRSALHNAVASALTNQICVPLSILESLEFSFCFLHVL